MTTDTHKPDEHGNEPDSEAALAETGSIQPAVDGADEDPEGADADEADEADRNTDAEDDRPRAKRSREDVEPSPHLLSIVESLLFAADKPLKVNQLRKLLGERSTARVKRALELLSEQRANSGIVAMEVDGGFQLRTNPANARWVRRLEEIRPVRMSRAGLEVLAVIAYRQPVTRAEVDQIRGVDSGAVLKQLLSRDLVRIIGRKDEPGRPFLYGTTHEFLSFFGLSNLSDLPSLRDVAELTRETVEPTRKGEADEDDDAETATAATDAPAREAQIAGEDALEGDEDELEEFEEEDEGDDEVADALEAARAAARGAERVKRKLRKLAASDKESVDPESAHGQMIQNLEQAVAVKNKPKAKDDPRPENEDSDATDVDETLPTNDAPAPEAIPPADDPLGSGGTGSA